MPPPSVRLVGGGGPVGTAADELSSNDGVLVSDGELETPEVATPAGSASDEAQKRSGHEKKKSLSANLKKLGNLGSAGKRGSVSSVNEIL